MTRLLELDTAEGRLAALEVGEPGDRPIVMQHGFPDHPPSFIPVAERLTAVGYRVILPFLRGYAPSTLSGPYHADQLGADVLALLDALGLERADVCGHDWGAVALYRFAALAPERLGRGVAMSVPFPLRFLGALATPRQLRRSWYMGYFQLPVLPERSIAGDLIERLWRDWSPGFELDPAGQRALHDCIQRSMPGPLGPYRAMTRPVVEAAGRIARARSEPPIEAPFLYLHGDNDGCIGPEVADGQERYFARPLVVERIEGAGHFLALEQPDIVAERISAFLKR